MAAISAAPLDGTRNTAASACSDASPPKAVIGDMNCSESFYCEIDDDSPKIVDVQLNLATRYGRATSILLENGLPIRYCYFNELLEDSPGEHDHFKVFHLNASARHLLFDVSVPSMWQTLNSNAKDELLVMLHAAKLLWRDLIFSIDSDEWISRGNIPSPSGIHSSLTQYGKETPPHKHVLQFLADGKDEKYLKALQDVALPGAPPFKLEEYWEVALASSMADSSGRSAVHRLLEMVVKLLYGFEESFSKVWILNITSVTALDILSISSSTSSKSLTKTRLNGEKQRPKSNEVGLEGSSLKRRRLNETEEDATPKRDVMHAYISASTAPKHQITVKRQNNDLSVVSFDQTTGSGKYIIMVEIHSEGKTIEEAEHKFMREMIHVLQSQSLVFGFLFSTKEIHKYAVEKKTSQDINIVKESYSLYEVENTTATFAFFDVGQFQKLIMDILSCVIHGLKFIEIDA